MSEEFYKWQVGDLSIELHHDEIHQRFEDEFEQGEDSAVIVCSLYHRTSILKEINILDDQEEVKSFMLKNPEYEMFRLMRYEHSQVSFRAFPIEDTPGYPYNCQWDSGMEGFVLAKPYDQYSAEERANSLLEEMTNFCNGEVYYYVIKNEDGEELDSCSGYTGYEHAKQSAIDAAYTHIEDPTRIGEICEVQEDG